MVYDGFHAIGLTGYSATVFRINIFDVYRLPSLDAFLATEHETFDTTDELLDAGVGCEPISRPPRRQLQIDAG